MTSPWLQWIFRHRIRSFNAADPKSGQVFWTTANTSLYWATIRDFREAWGWVGRRRGAGWGFRRGCSACLSPCLNHLGPEAPIIRDITGRSWGWKGSHRPRTGFLFPEQPGFSRAECTIKTSDKNAINLKIFSGWANYKVHQKQSEGYPVLYRDLYGPIKIHAKARACCVVTLLLQIFTECLLCTKHLCSMIM